MHRTLMMLASLAISTAAFAQAQGAQEVHLPTDWMTDWRTILSGTGALTVLGGVLGWIAKTLYENRRTRQRNAVTACQELLKIVGEYENAVREAVRLSSTAPATVEKLDKSIAESHFNYRLGQQLPLVHPVAVAECGRVYRLALQFQATALETKEYLKKLLTDLMMQPMEEKERDASVPYDVTKNYEARRGLVLSELLELGAELRSELIRSMGELTRRRF